MNGRIYDPQLGRFLSADIVVQVPNNLQSYNRFSYVLNNPIRLNDPTGYRWSSQTFEYWDASKEEIKQLGLNVEKAGGHLSEIGRSLMTTGPGFYGFVGGMMISGFGEQISDTGMSMQIDGNLFNAGQVAFNPLYIVENRAYEAFSGYGMQSSNLGNSLSKFERAVSGIEATVALAGTTVGFAGTVSNLGRIGGSNDLLKSTLRQVDSLDFSTPRNKATFFSGPGNKEKALSYVEKTGSMTIDQTQGGKFLNSLDLYGQFGEKADEIWAAASLKFANGASGKINLFTNGAAPDRIFKSVEEPILDMSIDLTKWTFHY